MSHLLASRWGDSGIKRECFLQQFSHSQQAVCHLRGGPLVLPRCIKDKRIKPLVLAPLSLAILLNLASHKCSFPDGISKLHLWRDVLVSAEETTKVARVFTAIILDQLGRWRWTWGVQIRDCLRGNFDEQFCKGIKSWRIPAGETESG